MESATWFAINKPPPKNGLRRNKSPIDFVRNRVGSCPTGLQKEFSPFLTRCSAKQGANKTDEGLLSAEPGSGSRPDGEARPVPAVSESCLYPGPSFSTGLVLDLGHPTAWDGVEIGSPVVKRYLSDEEERWHMWYSGRSGKNPGSESIGLAVSGNGVHWERGESKVGPAGGVGMVMSCSQEWWSFDTHNITPSEVLVMSSNKVHRSNGAVYWLYYTGSGGVVPGRNPPGFDFENPERAYLPGGAKQGIAKSLPGLAISQDGRHWARIEGEHHSGALLGPGEEGEWDSLFISSPCVVPHGNDGGDLRMYYHSFDAESGCFAVGMARSRDGVRWVKQGRVMGGGGAGAFDEMGAMNPNVVRERRSGRYVMAYEGVGADGRRSIGVATSADGLKGWRRVVGSSPVLEVENGELGEEEGLALGWLFVMALIFKPFKDGKGFIFETFGIRFHCVIVYFEV
ncbi:unnamed protein product [Cuscuta campestris]|uniref:Glycosyl hydrolase family 32 N-terminal domain-containing protein n=1 Tax=Cuscuta campestris TaxID=132261 RepID=A0A484KI10_9ASTE|nr:unnamed protein product [Cuscuta campestris]